MNNRDAAFVYVIGSDDGPLKIGVSKAPDKRLQGIQTSMHTPARIYFVKRFSRSGAYAVEQAVHARLSESRVAREWFAVEADVAANAIQSAAADLGIDEIDVVEEASPAATAQKGGRVTPEQCMAARAWLDIGQAELAAAAGVSEVTIRKFERKEGAPMKGTIMLIHLAIERLGIDLPDENTIMARPR